MFSKPCSSCMNCTKIKTVGVRAEIWWQIETELSTYSLSNLAVIRTLSLRGLMVGHEHH